VPLTPQQIETTTRLAGIFFSHEAKRMAEMRARNGRFVHYTSAENALSIIRSKRFWMRNVTCMSDFREVHHGMDALIRYFQTEPKRADSFRAAFDACYLDAAKEAIAVFDQWKQSTELQTYIASLSEHLDREDQRGRLSMWRAFGSGTTARVALVLNIPIEYRPSTPLNVIISPVAYHSDEALARELNSVVEAVRANTAFIRGALNRQQLIETVFMMLVTAAVCLKHEGFEEEKEWRVMYFPKRNPSPRVESGVEVVSGVPQLVYKIPLIENPPGDDSLNLAIPNLFDRVIIGPTQFPWVMYEAFADALTAAGVPNAASRVFVSSIPLRS
jgi:hypothetical protein